MLLYHAMMLAPMFILAEMSVGWIVAIAAVLLGGIYVWGLHRRVRQFRRALESGSTAELPVDASSLGELATAINPLPQRLRAIPMLLRAGILEQLGAGASHQLSRAARANALALIPTGTVELPAGTTIDAVPLT